MKTALLTMFVVADLFGAACGSSAPPASTKALTDVEFLEKISVDADQKTAPAPLMADYDAHGAINVCQQFVLDQLKAPATAQFTTPSQDAVTDLRGGKFRIVGGVDSQNSYSALIRNTYDCSVHWVGGTSWSLDDLNLTAR